MSQKHIATLCDDGWLCPGCPQVAVDKEAEVNQQLHITDDFGNRVKMSKNQFAVLVGKAKRGELDRI